MGKISCEKVKAVPNRRKRGHGSKKMTRSSDEESFEAMIAKEEELVNDKERSPPILKRKHLKITTYTKPKVNNPTFPHTIITQRTPKLYTKVKHIAYIKISEYTGDDNENAGVNEGGKLYPAT